MATSFFVHPNYLQEVNSAWQRKSSERESDLARELGQSLHLVIVNLFLKGEPVNRVNFIEICQFLELNWQEVAGLEEQESEGSSRLVNVGVGKGIFPPPEGGNVSEIDKSLKELVGTLCEMLRRLTRKAGDLLRADRTSIFLLDQYSNELGSVIADDGAGGTLLIDIPANKGIASLAARSLEVINIPFDVYNDPRSEEARKTDQKTGYRTYTMLAWPLFNNRKDLIAVVQLINKLKPNDNPDDELADRIDMMGFSQEDEAKFAKFAPSILKILEKCQFCYQVSLRLRNNGALKQGGVVLSNTELLAELKRQERQLRKSLNRI